MNQHKKRIIIFDDNESRLDSVQTLINLSDDMECVNYYTNTMQCVENVYDTQPDLILMDINMPVRNGIEATFLIKKSHPNIPIIIQTVHDDDDNIFNALKAGANGYILKTTVPDKFLNHIRDAFNGDVPMSGSVANKVLLFFNDKKNKKIQDKEYDLSKREKEILKLLIDGNSYKMIAQIKFISYNTVCNHINSIYRKLQVNSATEAISLAMKQHIV